MKSPLCPTRANQRTPGPLEGSSGGWELLTTKLIRSSEEPLEASQDNTYVAAEEDKLDSKGKRQIGGGVNEHSTG